MTAGDRRAGDVRDAGLGEEDVASRGSRVGRRAEVDRRGTEATLAYLRASKLIDPDTWYGGMPRALAWGEAKLYCVDTLGMLSTLSSDGTTVEPSALIPDAAKVSMRSAHFQASTRSLYYVLANAIYRYPVPDSPRVKLLFALD